MTFFVRNYSLSVLALSFLYAKSVSAAIEPLENPAASPTLQAFIQAVLQIVVKIGLPVATIFIIWSGFLFLTAQGEEAKITKARHAFTWAVIGTAILLGSWLLATAIKATIDQL